MLLIHNERKIKKLTKDFLNQIKYIKYWDKVEKFFIKKKEKNIDEFTSSFKHELNCDYDNESKIQALAYKYGYNIINEKLYSNKSLYVFKKTIWIEYKD